MARVTQTQLDNIQIDYGILYVDFGETSSALLGPTKGGAKFSASAEGHYIEFDGSTGLEAGTYVVDTINAALSATVKNLSADTLMLALPYATNTTGVITVGRANVGIVAKTKHLKNVTMFAKLLDGGYKKITVYNPLSTNGIDLTAAPKGEGEYEIKLDAHLDPTVIDEATDLLYKIEDVASIVIA